VAYDYLLVEKEEEVAVVVINRPKALNALSDDVLRELDSVITEVESDDSVRAVVITGDGPKAFVAGADIGGLKDLGEKDGEEFGRYGQRIFRRLETLPKAVIAAVNGFALGGGCELAMACDVRVASDTAKLGQPEVGLGIIPGYGGTQRLPRLVGYGQAKRLILSGEIIDAQEALRIGLVDIVVGADELREKAVGLARTIASKGPLAVAISKRAIDEGIAMSLDDALAHEAKLFGQSCATEDSIEGCAAFLEKRKPNFSGK
jgi:enoyl-CoA hydratase